MKTFSCTCCGKSCFDHRIGVCFPCGMAGAIVGIPRGCGYCRESDGPPVCPEHNLVDCRLMEHGAEGLRFWAEHGTRLEAHKKENLS